MAWVSLYDIFQETTVLEFKLLEFSINFSEQMRDKNRNKLPIYIASKGKHSLVDW